MKSYDIQNIEPRIIIVLPSYVLSVVFYFSENLPETIDVYIAIEESVQEQF